MRVALRLLQVRLEPQRHAALVLEGEVNVRGVAVQQRVGEAWGAGRMVAKAVNFSSELYFVWLWANSVAHSSLRSPSNG